MKKRAKILAMFFVALVMASSATGEIIYVDADAPGSNDGSGWADAYNHLQDTLAVAHAGDEIQVAQGTYKPDQGAGITPGNREATFQLKNGVTIKGGYAGFGESNPDARDIELYETILSGDLDGNDVQVYDPYDLLTEPTKAENSIHVVNGSGTDATAVLDGFTITAGNANGSYPDYCGGGMYINFGGPKVINCTFRGNTAKYGSGMYNDESSPTIKNCTFIGNHGRSNGGGVANLNNSRPTLYCCTFSENSATDGGGMYNSNSSPRLTNCTFIENSAKGIGGGLQSHTSYNTQTPCDLILTNCTFNGNYSRQGGGMYSYHVKAVLINCIFSENSAESSGGGMYNHGTSPTITNCLFIGNWGGQFGGGIHNWYRSSAILANCTFSGNRAESGGAICNMRRSTPILTNCILWDNAAIEGDNISLVLYHWAGNTYRAGISVSYSDVEGGESGAYVETGCTLNWGQGNFDAEPLFVEPGYRDVNDAWIEGDYHLLRDSPCINAGDPNYPYDQNETDLDGKPRVIGGRIDMGVYEYGRLVPSEVRIVPRTINLESSGKWITAFLWLPEGYAFTDIADIVSHSLLLDYEIEPERFRFNEEKQVVMARFSQEEVQTFLNVGEHELSISLQLMDGTVFEGRDIIRVTSKSGGKPDKYVQASNPNPADGATGVDINADLSWTTGSYVTSHDVYFGTSSPPPFVCNQIDTTFDPGTMDRGHTYYWRIDEVNKWGKATGQLWSFTTISGTPPPPPPP